MRINARRTFLTAVLLLIHHFLAAATIKPGGNIINETWTMAGTPYVIQGDITVPTGSTLAIEPGVEVQCVSGDFQAGGRDPARVEITIRGTLDVAGTAALPITFRSSSAVSNGWYGIIVATGGIATLEYGRIQNAVNGLTCETILSMQANNLVLFSNQTAIAVNAGSPTFDVVRAFANQNAMIIGGSGAATIVDSALHANWTQGVQINSSSTGSLTIDHCTLHTNGTYGVFLASTSRLSVILKNSVVSGHGSGVYRAAAAQGTVTTTYSDIWNATNFVNAVAGTRVITEDPRYIDVNGPDNVLGTADDNLRLRADSPCINGGDEGRDMGAYYPTPRAVLLPLQFSGNDVRVRFLSVPDVPNQVEHTEDFVTWNPLGSSIVGTGGTLEVIHNAARITLPRRFYRVRLDY